jgi:hypothetical protein
LFLSEIYRCLKQLSIRIVYELNHWDLPAMLPF